MTTCLTTDLVAHEFRLPHLAKVAQDNPLLSNEANLSIWSSCTIHSAEPCSNVVFRLNDLLDLPTSQLNLIPKVRQSCLGYFFQRVILTAGRVVRCADRKNMRDQGWVEEGDAVDGYTAPEEWSEV